MSNLKKLLCLALALAMALSLIAIPSASAAGLPKNVTDYGDASTIGVKYLEAIDVLTAIGILTGDDDDNDGTYNFSPQSNFTRAQASKIMAYYLLGKTGAELLPVPTTAPFTDVPVSAWEAKFVAYCKNQGVINGVGDNKFDPNGTVSVVQMLKMLLAATGYGARGEFVGDSWALNVLQIANARGLITSADGATDLTDAAARELIVYYVFKALTGQSLVTFNTLFGDYVEVNNSIFTTVSNPITQAEKMYNLYQFIEGQVDVYGVPGHKWRQLSTDITGFYTNGTVVDEFVAGTALYAYGMAKYRWSLNSTDQYKYFDNYGYSSTASLIFSDNGFTSAWTAADINSNYRDANKNSFMYPAFDNYDAQITLYDLDDNGTVDFLVRKDNFLAKVRSLSASTATLDVYLTPDQPTTTTTGTISNTTGLAVGDYLWVNIKLANYASSTWTWKNSSGNANTILGYGKVDLVDSNITSYGYGNRGFNLADGKLYWTAAPRVAPNAPTASPSYDDATFYLSPNGYVLGYTATTSSYIDLDYALLVDLDINGVTAGINQSSQANVAKALIFKTDGSYAWVNVKTSGTSVTGITSSVLAKATTTTGLVNSSGYLDMAVIGGVRASANTSYHPYADFVEQITGGTVSGNVEGEWYTYTVDANGYYTFRAVNFQISSTKNLTSLGTATTNLSLVTNNSKLTASTIKGSTQISSTSTTKFILVSGGSVISRTGYSNFVLPKKNNNNNLYTYDSGDGYKSIVIPTDDGNYVAGVYVIDTRNSGVGTTTKNYAVILPNGGMESYRQSDRDYNVYRFDADTGKYVTALMALPYGLPDGVATIVEITSDGDAVVVTPNYGTIIEIGADYIRVRDSVDGEVYHLPINVANQTLAAVDALGYAYMFGATTFTETTTTNIFYTTGLTRIGQVVAYIRTATNVVPVQQDLFSICNTPAVVYYGASGSAPAVNTLADVVNPLDLTENDYKAFANKTEADIGNGFFNIVSPSGASITVSANTGNFPVTANDINGYYTQFYASAGFHQAYWGGTHMERQDADGNTVYVLISDDQYGAYVQGEPLFAAHAVGDPVDTSFVPPTRAFTVEAELYSVANGWQPLSSSAMVEGNKTYRFTVTLNQIETYNPFGSHTLAPMGTFTFIITLPDAFNIPVELTPSSTIVALGESVSGVFTGSHDPALDSQGIPNGAYGFLVMTDPLPASITGYSEVVTLSALTSGKWTKIVVNTYNYYILMP